MNGITCPDCNSETLDPKYAQDNFYVCAKCGKAIGYLCTGCDEVYFANRLGLHGDVYECKICGKIQWGYTEWKRNKKGE